MLRLDDLRGRFLPAVPVPFHKDGRIHEKAHDRYVAHMAEEPIGGVAVWAHTGRGLRLSAEQRARVLSAWREALGKDQILVASAGGAPGERAPEAILDSARAMACQAAELGADALLVHPPMALRDLEDADSQIVRYHAAVAEAGLPLILFYLYPAAGGVAYSLSLLEELLSWEQVLGIKVATLDSVMTFQDIAQLVQAQRPRKILVTGEDRFLGYSLMCGAKAALIGMGAACTSLQSEYLEHYWACNPVRLLEFGNQIDDFELDDPSDELMGTIFSLLMNGGKFLALNSRVDDLARSTFKSPMEGYIQRMLWCLVHEGVIPLEAAHDPWGPPLPAEEFDQIRECLDRIDELP